MERSSFSNRRYVSAISAGMLSIVLLLSSCAASRESRTAIHSESLQRSGTEVITSVRDPMRMASLTLEGIGVQKKENGLDLRIESDGEGGLMVTAQTEGKEQVTIERSLTENQEVTDTLKEEITPSPSFWERAKIKVIGVCLACLLLLIGTRWLKSKLKNNLKSD
jgi:hypothetical protein